MCRFRRFFVVFIAFVVVVMDNKSFHSVMWNGWWMNQWRVNQDECMSCMDESDKDEWMQIQSLLRGAQHRGIGCFSYPPSKRGGCDTNGHTSCSLLSKLCTILNPMVSSLPRLWYATVARGAAEIDAIHKSPVSNWSAPHRGIWVIIIIKHRFEN